MCFVQEQRGETSRLEGRFDAAAFIAYRTKTLVWKTKPDVYHKTTHGLSSSSLCLPAQQQYSTTAAVVALGTNIWYLAYCCMYEYSYLWMILLRTAAVRVLRGVIKTAVRTLYSDDMTQAAWNTCGTAAAVPR